MVLTGPEVKKVFAMYFVIMLEMLSIEVTAVNKKNIHEYFKSSLCDDIYDFYQKYLSKLISMKCKFLFLFFLDHEVWISIEDLKIHSNSIPVLDSSPSELVYYWLCRKLWSCWIEQSFRFFIWKLLLYQGQDFLLILMIYSVSRFWLNWLGEFIIKIILSQLETP